MTEAQYLENFGAWNVILDIICPDLDEDMMVINVKSDPNLPNFEITASACTGSYPTEHTLIGDPFTKIISREVLRDMLGLPPEDPVRQEDAA